MRQSNSCLILKTWLTPHTWRDRPIPACSCVSVSENFWLDCRLLEAVSAIVSDISGIAWFAARLVQLVIYEAEMKGDTVMLRTALMVGVGMVLFAVLVFSTLVFSTAGCGSYYRVEDEEWAWPAELVLASATPVSAGHPGQAGRPEHRRLKAALEQIRHARETGISEAEVRRLAREALARGDLAPDPGAAGREGRRSSGRWFAGSRVSSGSTALVW